MKNQAVYTNTKCKVVKKSWLWMFWKLWFPGADTDRVVVAFGRNVYAPSASVSPDLWMHEHTHLLRQHYSFFYAFWWHLKYRFSSKFRYNEEVLAYGEQLRYVKSQSLKGTYEGRKVWQWREAMAKLLSSKLYGSIATFDEASEAIDRASF